MFAQLIKHEFKATRRLIPWIFLVTLFMVATSLLVRQLGLTWLNGLIMVLLFLCGLAGVLMTYVLVIYRYYKNLYNSEGYLTHTLPVRAGQMLGSKTLVAFSWIFLSYLFLFSVILVILPIIAEMNGQPQPLGEILREIRSAFQLDQASFNWMLALLFAYGVLAIFYQLAMIYFSITFGSTARFHSLGVGGPILTFLALYVISQIGTLVFMLFIPAGLSVENRVLHFAPNGMLVTLIDPERFVFGLGSVLFMILTTIALFMVTKRLIARSTSLR